MMTWFKLCLLVTFTALPFCLSAAEDGSDEQKKIKICRINDSTRPVDGESIAAKAGAKFVRGLTNVVTGVGEIPRQIIVASKTKSAWIAVPEGFFTGVFMFVVRTTYGVFEVATFPAPVECTYDSLLTPAYVWGPIEKK